MKLKPRYWVEGAFHPYSAPYTNPFPPRRYGRKYWTKRGAQKHYEYWRDVSRKGAPYWTFWVVEAR